LTTEIEIMPDQLDVSVDADCMLQQAGRRITIAANCGNPASKDTGFFIAYAVPAIAQKIHVIERYAGNYRAIWIEGINCIQPATQADFKDSYIQPGLYEMPHRSQRTEFKIG